jgi:hypothetical protein
VPNRRRAKGFRKDSRWCICDHEGRLSSAVHSEFPLTRNTTQGVGDPPSGQRPMELWPLPWGRHDCLCQITGIEVRILVIGIHIVDSFWCYSDWMMEVYLRTMSDGRIHPNARCPTIHYSRSDVRASHTRPVLITNSRLVVIAKLWGMGAGYVMIIWDWKSSQILFVRRLFLHQVMQAT